MARAPWLPFEAQTSYREHYRAARPGWLASGDQFDLLVQKHISAESRVLDLGCGRTGGMERFWQQARLAVGIDPDRQSLAGRGPGMDVLQGGGERQQVADGDLDILVSVWVIEHLVPPERV